MASAFQSGSSGTCQGIDCKSGDFVATFSIKEQQDLCEDCVSSKAQTIRDQEPQDWSCDKHRQPIKYFCRTHGVPLCQTCAFLLHQKPCTVQDLEDAVREKRSRLELLLPRVTEKRHELQQKASMIKEYGGGLEQHFKSVKDKIERTFGTESKDIDSLEERELESLRKDADERIRKIEEERNTQLEKRRQMAYCKREKIVRTKQTLSDDLIKVQERTLSKVDKLKSQVDRVMDYVENAQRRLDKLVMDDRDLIGQADMFETSLTRMLDTDINVNVLERTVQRGQQVHFKLDENVHESKVLGAEESWELIDSVAIEKNLVKPYFVGAIDEEKMVVSDMSCRTLYVTNLKDKATSRVLERSGDYKKVVSCTSVGKGMILCGNFCKDATGSCFKGASLYNRHWEFIRDVELPKNHESEQTFASVNVEKGGRILAAVACQSDIHVINPDDGIVTQSVQTGVGKIQWLRSLPSGNLVAKTGPCEFTIMDPTRSNRICIKNDLWDGCLYDVDLSDGSIYVVYRDKTRKVYAVDVVSSDGELEATKVVEYPVSKNRKDVVLPCVVTASGKLITCNGEYFYVFKLS
ncbi:uncharacterized protein LOC105437574 [Strongylocentrotus purpuratus]|uniref:B box-type domain-containing protein n=1 Tax=Strongylocentrotus purpuratus TaxID=7668 RepID=A0A7M7PGW8_STRPU|nr:uncharacterized protein LOC105437574 [Strongylocentrotus purpuratus]|eukprot:XP_011662625.1 PREDICTED: uncharacterized protein LOC105437574 [Strongylocentrotus purpuratus]